MPAHPKGPNGDGRRVLLWAVAAVAAAAVATGAFLVLFQDSGDAEQAAPADKPPPPAAPHDEEPGGPEGPDDEEPRADPRGGVVGVPEPVVGPDWAAVVHETSEIAWDIPPQWTWLGPDYALAIERDVLAGEEPPDMPELLVGVRSVGAFQENWCEGGTTPRAFVGARRSNSEGVTSEDTALAEAEQWAFARYNQSGFATEEFTGPEPFASEHGLEGHLATATISGVLDEDCSSDGKVTVVSFMTPQGDLASWILVSDTGFDDEPDQEVVDLMLDSLRPVWD